MWTLVDKYWHSSEPVVFIFRVQDCEEVVVTLMTNDYCWKASYILWYLFFTFFNGWMNKWLEDQNYYFTLFFGMVLNLCQCMVSRFHFQIFCLLLSLFLCFLCRDHSASPGGSERDMPGGTRSDISADSIERNGGGGMGMEGQQRFERSQARFLDELRSRDAKIVQVTYPRTANNEKELTVIRGEFLEVSYIYGLF